MTDIEISVFINRGCNDNERRKMSSVIQTSGGNLKRALDFKRSLAKRQSLVE